MILTECDTYSEDTPDDLKKVDSLMAEDKLLLEYKEFLMQGQLGGIEERLS